MGLRLKRFKTKIGISTPHTFPVSAHGSLRFCGGLILALTWLALSAAQAQTTNSALGTTILVVGPAAGTNSVGLGITPATGAWTATTNAAWVHLNAANQSGTGSTNVIFSYDANSGATRSGTLTIAGQTLTVIQAGSTYVAADPLTTLVPLGGEHPRGAQGPLGVAVDGSGNVYSSYAEGGDSPDVIEEWTVTNNSLEFVWPVSSAYDVAADNAGNLYFAVFGVNSPGPAIQEWTVANSNLVTLVSLGLNDPCGVALDSAGNVYIADTGNNAIKEWTAANSNVTTLVSSGLSNPQGVAVVDMAGNVYIADTGNSAIKEWTVANSNVTTLVSSGLSSSVVSVAVDGSGNVYIADTDNSDIKEWTASDSSVITLESFEGFGRDTSVAVDNSGNVYIADSAIGNWGPIEELPYAFVDPSPKLEGLTSGNDVLVVLPTTVNLLPPFNPISDQSWLTITGITNGVVTFSFSDTTSNRTGFLTVLGQVVPVTQGGPSYSLGTTALLEGPTAGSDSVVLSASPNFSAWTASANASWLHLNPANQSGAGSTNVVFSFDANLGATRSGPLTIAGQTLTVIQAGSTYVAAEPVTTLVPFAGDMPRACT
jgi:hypothetical protein